MDVVVVLPIAHGSVARDLRKKVKRACERLDGVGTMAREDFEGAEKQRTVDADLAIHVGFLTHETSPVTRQQDLQFLMSRPGHHLVCTDQGFAQECAEQCRAWEESSNDVFFVQIVDEKRDSIVLQINRFIGYQLAMAEVPKARAARPSPVSDKRTTMSVVLRTVVATVLPLMGAGYAAGRYMARLSLCPQLAQREREVATLGEKLKGCEVHLEDLGNIQKLNEFCELAILLTNHPSGADDDARRAWLDRFQLLRKELQDERIITLLPTSTETVYHLRLTNCAETLIVDLSTAIEP